MIGQIARAASEQAQSLAQMNSSISHMDQSTQQNAPLFEESAAAAESLKSQAQSLVIAVSVFQVREDGNCYYGSPHWPYAHFLLRWHRVQAKPGPSLSAGSRVARHLGPSHRLSMCGDPAALPRMSLALFEIAGGTGARPPPCATGLASASRLGEPIGSSRAP